MEYEQMLVLAFFHRMFSPLQIYAFMQIASQTAAEEPALIILFLCVTDMWSRSVICRYTLRFETNLHRDPLMEAYLFKKERGGEKVTCLFFVFSCFLALSCISLAFSLKLFDSVLSKPRTQIYSQLYFNSI